MLDDMLRRSKLQRQTTGIHAHAHSPLDLSHVMYSLAFRASLLVGT